MKQLFLRVCKGVGLFHLARRMTADKARILCYHGIAIEDEHQFRPGLFMQSGLFRQRLALIKKWRFKVVSLDDLHAKLAGAGNVRDLLTITIDDGWAGIEQGMADPLHQAGYPATLYLSSYYAQKQIPVFNVAVAYLLWKGGGSLQVAQDSLTAQTLGSTTLSQQSIAVLEERLDAEQRCQVLQEVCLEVGVDYQGWLNSGKFMYLDIQALKRIQTQGISMELHTHRHTFPQQDPERARREVEENRQWIAKNLEEQTRHFCYPSGEYAASQFELLKQLGIDTATTTENELADRDRSLFELPRIMDANRVSNLEFEAELSGFMTLLRSTRKRLG
ncbi:polysaccharide deacetylase family protein [Bowmanella dokdonensis]|uniref:Polysaccharide deacetylase family protein n=1 Tax=Bowmanella dokdonensis TaxID=751969 RepID=A0A939DQW5_9ALTE|nr:polysaccharide deacetylase family protein [Bowmanella dokdonensis]